MDLGERLRGLREDADKTQAEIAAILGTTQQYYGKYESGKRPLPIDRLYPWLAGRAPLRSKQNTKYWQIKFGGSL